MTAVSSKQVPDLPQTTDDDHHRCSLAQVFAQIYSRVPEEGQNYTISTIEALFKEVGLPVPPAMYRANEIMQSKLSPVENTEDSALFTPAERASILVELISLADEMGKIYAMVSGIKDQMAELLMPDKEITNAAGKVEKLSEEDRKLRVKAALVPYQAIEDIVFYMFAICGRMAPSIHQTVLGFERDVIKI